MKRINLNIFLKILVLVVSTGSYAWGSCIYNDFNGWKDCFIKEKLSHQLNSIDLDTFKEAKYNLKVIELDRKQPEKLLTFDAYLKKINIESKKKQGKEYYFKYKQAIDDIAIRYGIESSILVALIGLESDYGTYKGNYNVIDSLATLSYEGRRKEFFEKELINVLKVAYNEGLRYEEIKGSWAGAMGQCQFMPSSYIAYGVDYDKDGKVDIWNSIEDILASSANYLKKNGWKKDNFKIRKINNNVIEDENNKLVILEGGEVTQRYEVSKNFDVLMKWNRSKYFCLAVFMIAESIGV